MSIGSHGLEVGRDYELTIGSSFQSGRARDAYHLMRYDFKPASIDTNRPAHFEVGEAKQCTVTIPNIQDSSSSATTTYKGGKKPCTKECVLIIDKQTGQITLERITSTIPLKKCRNDKQSMVPKAHSEMENMEVMEKSMNLKKMLKDKRQPAKGDKSEKKGGSSSGSSGTIGSGKQSKDAPPGTTTTSQGSASKSSSKQSSSSSHPPPPPPTPPSNAPSLNNPPQQPQQQPPASGALNASNGNSNGAAKNTPTNVPARQRLMSSSDMSVSSASSDSSDSDSSDEGGDAKTPSKPSKPANPPPPPKMDRSPPSKSNHEPQQQQQQQQRQQSFPPKTDPSPAKQPPPAPKVERSPAKPLPKEATVKGKEKAFLSTLQSDLQLSDSDGSDSD